MAAAKPGTFTNGLSSVPSERVPTHGAPGKGDMARPRALLPQCQRQALVRFSGHSGVNAQGGALHNAGLKGRGEAGLPENSCFALFAIWEQDSPLFQEHSSSNPERCPTTWQPAQG